MNFTIAELFQKAEEIEGVLKRLYGGNTLCDADLDIVKEALSEYQNIILGTKVKIG